jgi:hypothetical protein
MLRFYHSGKYLSKPSLLSAKAIYTVRLRFLSNNRTKWATDDNMELQQAIMEKDKKLYLEPVRFFPA